MSHIDPLDGAVVVFLNYATGTCIDLPHGSPENETPLIGFQFHAGENQQWKIQRADSSTVWPAYKLINVQSSTCMDLTNGNPANGTLVIGQVNQPNNNNQLWRLVSADPLGRVYMIQNVAGSTYIDLAGQDPANGTTIHGWEGTIQEKNLAQLWRILIIN
ncbi:carbohydrate-binding module family 13 protein [Xylaria sp. FL0043]|nr:carbohydrate-binding module family 13 protein [Xylaria sp. FL0043]